ncbi:MAG: LysM peptidoglycan-binding domain-containing protein [Chloroflexota bacterium]
MGRYGRLVIIGLCIVLCALAMFGVLQVHAQGQTHTVQPGENLFRIALRYGTTVDAIAAANNIVDTTHVFVGQVLVIPGAAAPQQAPQQVAQVAAQPVQPLPAVPAASTNSSTVYYTVQPGETLSIISRRYGITWLDLVNANKLVDPNHIEAGQQIVIPGAASPAGNAVAPALPVDTVPAQPVIPPTAVPPTAVQPTFALPTAIPATVAPPPQASSPTIGDKTYVVQPGEGLAAIGRKFGIDWANIAGANNITDPNHIYAGMTLKIPSSVPSTTTMETSIGVPPGPAPTVPSGKYIRIKLSEQRVYVYQDGQMIHTMLGSSGLPGTPTVQGDFKIYVKYTAQLMTGPGYYLPGVPWVMYFYEGYSFHGTYWHHNFGHPMSHGCMNLPTDEALWLYNWAEVGTPVHVEW